MTFYLSLRNGEINGIKFQEKMCGTASYWQRLLDMPTSDTLEVASFFFKKIEFNGTPLRVNGRWGKGSDELFDVTIYPNENKNFLMVKDTEYDKNLCIEYGDRAKNPYSDSVGFINLVS